MYKTPIAIKTYFKLAAVLAMIVMIGSCKKDAFVPRTTLITKSVQDFFNRNKPKPEFHYIDGVSGGSFTTAQGTTVIIPPYAFADQFGNFITSAVEIEFLDIYKKSDMVWTGMTTQTSTGEPLKSGGEFFIRAKANNIALNLAGSGPIKVIQPLNNFAADPGMQPYVSVLDSSNLAGWELSGYDSISLTATSYIYTMYQPIVPAGSGVWLNSDNSTYFSTYTQSPLTMHFTGIAADYSPDIFLVFDNINTTVHVYSNYFGDGSDFTYSFAPVGLSCTAVAVGEKNGILYASFTPVTISTNQTVNFNMTQTTEADFKTALEALN